MGVLMRRRAFHELLLAAGACAAFSRVARAQTTPSTLVVVVGPGSPIRDLSLQTLRALFLGQQVENANGQKILCFNDAPGAPARALFERLALKMSSVDLSRHWVDRMIRGQSGPPRASPSAATRQKLLMRFADAITYVPLADLDPTARAITIDGKRHDQPGYPLTAR